MKILRIIFAFLPLLCFSQKQGNNWYFGDHAGLSFSTGTPVALTNGAIYDGPDQSEGTSVISDSSGALLFYTNGQKVWTKNHQVMPNGDSLLGNYSSTQAALIVPVPGSSRYFYVFTTDAFQNNLLNGFSYSVVDMCLNNGLGDVIASQKNIVLLDNVAEKLTAVRHDNGIDYWIIVHKYFSDEFDAFQLTSSGITNTVTSNIGSVHQGYCGNPGAFLNAMGSMKASPNGNKIAIVSGNQCNNISELFDFDKATGFLSNVIRLRTDSMAVGLYGVSFSPDNSKLYISSWLTNDRIYQHDLSSNTPSIIVNSKTIVASHAGGGPWFMAMQLGPDGKIYIAQKGETYMGAIKFPNLPGLNCMYKDTIVTLGGKKNVSGLPNFIDFFNYSNTVYKQNPSDLVSQLPDPICPKISGNYSATSPLIIDSWQWDFGDNTSVASQNTAHTYTAMGTYNYTLTAIEEGGCALKIIAPLTVIDCRIFNDCEVFIPSAFSPDGNGVNDVACVYGDCIKEMEFKIYSRWGEVVFSTTDQTKCWNGIYKGEKLTDAVFAYTLKATLYTDNKIIKKGNITLIK